MDTQSRPLCLGVEYVLDRVLHVTTIEAAALIVRERRAFAVGQTRIFEKLVGAHHVFGGFDMVARQILGGPQRTVRDARMQKREIAIAQHARFRRHLLIGQNGPLRIRCELGAGRRCARVSGNGEQQTGKPLLHVSVSRGMGAQV